jgi:DNA transformation protein
MSEFTDYLSELLADFGEIHARKMFGGYGIYHQGLMFGLVADNTLYLKADAQSAPAFTARGLPAFMYQKGQRRVQMSYYQAPEEALDHPEEMRTWAQLAYDAALRNRR